jgi:hypothetical protein
MKRRAASLAAGRLATLVAVLLAVSACDGARTETTSVDREHPRSDATTFAADALDTSPTPDARDTSTNPDATVTDTPDDPGPDVIDTTDTTDPSDTTDTTEPSDTSDTTDSSDTTDPADTTDPSDPTDTDTVPPPTGTPSDPIPLGHFPFVYADDTRLAASRTLDRYTCAPNTNESGPERVFVFDVTASGTLTAEVAESSGVDVDLHLLTADPALAPAAAVPCLARANTKLVQDLAPGRYYLAIDTYVAVAGEKPGAYRVAVEWVVPDAWQVVPVAPGIVWKQKVYSSYAGGRQTINVLDVDLAEPTVTVRPHGGQGCLRASTTAPVEGAIAAINAGFFDTGPGTCPPLDLIKIEGRVVSLNHLTGAAQRSFGVDDAMTPMVAWIDANRDWPAAWSALGSYPSLVIGGQIVIEPEKDTSFFTSRHPRSALGLTADEHLLLVTVDGRTAAGAGMTMRALAQHMVNLGAVEAMNLDGGGSTALWIRDQSLNGIVNFPSDNDAADHLGERAVSDLLLVFSRAP